jgi:hypothetical protein
MAEERCCKTCVTDCVNVVCIGLDKWQPIAQGKPMEKIRYTQQEWANIINDLDWNPDVMEELKQKGYIRKSAVEEAEEMYREWLNRIGDMSENVVMEMDKMYSAIQEFKSEIARLKK